MTTIVIQAFGTPGDVAPYTGLALRLQQAGYRVAIAAQAPYEDPITELGIEFRLVPKDTEAATKQSELAQQFIDGKRMRPSRAMIAEMSEGLQATRQADFAAAHRRGRHRARRGVDRRAPGSHASGQPPGDALT